MAKLKRNNSKEIMIRILSVSIGMVLGLVLSLVIARYVIDEYNNNTNWDDSFLGDKLNTGDNAVETVDTVEDTNKEVETDAVTSVDTEEHVDTTPVIEKNVLEFSTINIDNSKITSGNLILVNGQYQYDFENKTYQTKLYGNRTKVYQLSGSELALENTTFKALDNMLVQFNKDTNNPSVLVNTAYRSLEDQQSIVAARIEKVGEEETYKYVAKPGHSEHHTGMAADMCFFIDGAQQYFTENADGKWFDEHSSDYGFILRYTEEKKDITGCEAEPWHYRYVGIVHAKLMNKLKYCMEEYITYLSNYSVDGSEDTTKNQILWVKDDYTTEVITLGSELPESGHLVYFVAMNSVENNTVVPIPSTFINNKNSYEISGNNVNGFVITIDLTK